MHNNYGDIFSPPTLRELQSWSKIMGETEPNQAHLLSTLATAWAWFPLFNFTQWYSMWEKNMHQNLDIWGVRSWHNDHRRQRREPGIQRFLRAVSPPLKALCCGKHKGVEYSRILDSWKIFQIYTRKREGTNVCVASCGEKCLAKPQWQCENVTLLY